MVCSVFKLCLLGRVHFRFVKGTVQTKMKILSLTPQQVDGKSGEVL